MSGWLLSLVVVLALVVAVVLYNSWEKMRLKAASKTQEQALEAISNPTNTSAVAVEQTSALPAPQPEAVAPGKAPLPADFHSKLEARFILLGTGGLTRAQAVALSMSLPTDKPARVLGQVGAQWRVLGEAQSYLSLLVLLQLADRRGPLMIQPAQRFSQAIEGFASAHQLHVEGPTTARMLSMAAELDAFAAGVDLVPMVYVVPEAALPPAVWIKALEAEGGQLLESGHWLWPQAPALKVRPVGPQAEWGQLGPLAAISLSFEAVNTDQVIPTFTLMGALLRQLCQRLAARRCDDQGRDISNEHWLSLGRRLEKSAFELELFGIPSGSELAQRLFSPRL